MVVSLTSRPSFQYKPLDTISHNIRLLRILPFANRDLIECTLEQSTLDQAYVCLSYCWGADQDHQSILVNDEVFLVRPNLYAFLSLAREYGFHQPIWIDAVCINQADMKEKNKQVQMMGKIYSSAMRTVVWLGLTPSDCDRIPMLSSFNSSAPEQWELEALQAAFGEFLPFDVSQPIVKGEENCYPRSREELNLTAMGEELLDRWFDYVNGDNLVYRLASSEYWKRTWIIQELLLSKNPVLFCEIDDASVRGLLPLILSIVYTMRCRHEEQSVEWQRLRDLETIIYNVALGLDMHTPVTAAVVVKQMEFSQAMRLTAGRSCTDRRDRVSAILSLVKNGERFRINYKQSLDGVLVDVLRFHIANGYTVGKRFLSGLFEDTANVLEIRPPNPKALPEMVSLLDELSNLGSVKDRFFWARVVTRPGMDYPPADDAGYLNPWPREDLVDPPPAGDQNCSLCMGFELHKQQVVLEILCISSEELKCHGDVLCWRLSEDGRWECDCHRLSPRRLMDA